MSFHDLVQLYFERSNSLQAYWTVYVVVIGGLLAFSSLRKERDTLSTVLITVLFCFFAYKNLDAIHDVTLQRFAGLKAMQFTEAAAESVRQILLPTMTPPAWEGVRNFHIVSDLITIAVLWAMERRRRPAAEA
jgi:hypothetical protein